MLISMLTKRKGGKQMYGKDFWDKLQDKYLRIAFEEICDTVIKSDFEIIFKWACDNPDKKDTTFGTCMRRLEKIAIVVCKDDIKNRFQNFRKKYNVYDNDVFFAICDDLLEEFIERIDYQGFVECIMGDEWNILLDDLVAKGIVDSEGEKI